MKIELEAEVIEDQEGTLLLKLKTGFGDPEVRVCKEPPMKNESREAEIAERLAKATPGEWGYDSVNESSCGSPCTPDGCRDSHFSGFYEVSGPKVEIAESPIYVDLEADAHLIAASPADLAYLLDRNRELEALATGLARALESAKESLGHCQGETDKQRVWGLAMEAELGITFVLQTPEVRALLSKAAKSQEGA